GRVDRIARRQRRRASGPGVAGDFAADAGRAGAARGPEEPPHRGAARVCRRAACLARPRGPGGPHPASAFAGQADRGRRLDAAHSGGLAIGDRGARVGAARRKSQRRQHRPPRRTRHAEKRPRHLPRRVRLQTTAAAAARRPGEAIRALHISLVKVV
ncbi:hypothetical protein M885DRAFT_610949, partial [Pelagophyceae sp. CCMP2097]